MDKTPVSIMANIKSMCPTFSIIIPHYDIPDLLMRCLKSIPVSEDIQVIVVDDNSPDADTYLERYPELSRPYLEFIRTTKGEGAGYARNLALPYVRGKWVIFADADDFFNPIFNDKLDLYKDSAYDFIIFSANSVDSDTYENVSRVKFLTTAFDKYEEDKKKGEILLKYYCGVPWAKFIKNDLIDKNNILFDEVPMHNDMHFAYLVSYHSTKFQVDRTAIYCVTDRKSSVSKNISQEALLARIYVIGAMNKFYKEHNIPINIDNLHLIQLTKLFFCDKNGYKKGRSILKEMGYKASYLNISMFKIILKSLFRKLLFVKIIKR